MLEIFIVGIENKALDYPNEICSKKIIMTLANFSLGGSTRNHLTKITRKLDPIFKNKIHLLIH
jgi:hypothetical protein